MMLEEDANHDDHVMLFHVFVYHARKLREATLRFIQEMVELEVVNDERV